MTLHIDEVTEVTAELVEAFGSLLPQISAAAPALSAADLEEIVRAPSSTLFVAREQTAAAAQIVGSATLIIFRIPSGRRARLESVVVDRGARNRGIGQALCTAAITRARAAGVSDLDLTCNPTRTSANRLYERMGFRRRETNIYRLCISDAHHGRRD